MKNYELIEHTADIGIRVKAKDLKGLFVNTALAMFDVAAKKTEDIKQESENRNKKTEIEIRLEAKDLEELFINWLNELLSLSAVKELIFSAFPILKIDNNSLKAIAIGEQSSNYQIKSEIKAATYCDLKIENIGGSWQAEVIFDV